jgi:hypothetical protein
VISVEKADTPQDQNGLERSVSLFQATVYGVGIILGANEPAWKNFLQEVENFITD